jgi:hypothetical protein
VFIPDQIKADEKKQQMTCKILTEIYEGNEHLVEQHTDGEDNTEILFRRAYEGWAGFICLRIGTSGGPL